MNLIGATQIHSAVLLVPRGAAMNGVASSELGLAIAIDGTYDGSLTLGEGSFIHIRKGANVRCDGIQADSILVEGAITGGIVSRSRLELKPEARVDGDVQYVGDIAVHPGARISGTILSHATFD